MADFIKILEKPTLYEAVDTDDIKVVVGGINTDYFAPSVNISFKFQSGEEKAFFNICDDIDQIKTVWIAENFNGSKLAIRDGDVESTFELLPMSLKIERVFYVKPTVAPKYKLTFSQGISFHYQPELITEEMAEGRIRPDNVVGSYAVYCDKSGHHKDSNGSTLANYGCGKIGHLYAPYWIDAAGKKIKGTQEIKDSILTFPLPDSKWLDSATLPIKLDPDVGYTTVGETLFFIAGKLRGNHRDGNGDLYTVSSTADKLDKIYIYTNTNGVSFSAGVYDHDGSNNPDNLIDNVAVTSALSSWVEGNLGQDVSLTPSAGYSMAMAFSTGVNVYYDSVPGASYLYNNSISTLPDPYSGTIGGNALFSIYFSYTESGGLTLLPKIMNQNGNLQTLSGGLL